MTLSQTVIRNLWSFHPTACDQQTLNSLLLYLLQPLFMGWKAPLAQPYQCHLAAVVIYNRKDSLSATVKAGSPT